ncbi:MAG: SLBB domain-containing protein [Candidatus Marinimicrobia bacterium]|nr:SLBB domain-containing protein [Candidatus Neomarinimicrobiota bacterium]
MKKIIIFLILILLSSYLLAQDMKSRYGSNEITYPVKIWGEVVRPGIYDFPLGQDMMAALSLAGGPTMSAKLTDVRVLRTKLEKGEKSILIYVNLEKYFETGDKALLPEIRRGDTIIIPPKFGKKMGEFLNGFKGLMAIIQTAVMIEYYLGRTN